MQECLLYIKRGIKTILKAIFIGSTIKNEWLQMDKIGHTFTSYHITEQLHQQFLWSGYSNNQSLLLSSILSFSMMTGIEIFDAYSEKWGASTYDILSNFVGTFFFTGQMLIFKKQMFHIKFSFYPSSYARKRPEALGLPFN